MENSSILVPKIDVVETAPINHASVHLEEEKTTIPVELQKTKKTWPKVMLSIAVFLLVFLVYNVISGLIIYQKTQKLINNAKVLAESTKSQDIVKIKTDLANTKKSLNATALSFKMVAWEKFLPFVGVYISDVSRTIKAGQAGLDAGESVLTVIEPYSDLLGFKNGESSNVLVAVTGEQTAQDRIDFIVKTIPDLIPQIDVISGKVKIIQDEISQINPDRYPENFKGIAIRSKIKSIEDLVSQVSTLLVNGKPFLESAPYLLGVDSPRTYLVLFQNDKELRPTGGFMTAYALLKMDKAKVSTVTSSDIYSLDAIYKPSIQAPQPIIKYIKGPYILSQKWRLRDMNWSPDFTESMKVFVPAAKQAGISGIDGVIAVDTQVLVNILNVIGPIGVPGFGNFSTAIDPECNCAQVIHELEAFADVEGPIIWDPLTGVIIQRPPNSDNRKKIIGPLMNSILANAMGQPKEKIPGLVQAGFSSLIEKHVLFYLLDENVQKAVADFGLSGTINNYEGDYLHISDANLGGRKSNLYAYETVDQNIEVAGDGSVTKTLTITYQNPEKQDGWLNSVLPTWVRVYVPKGSKLITSEGLETTAEPYEDLGKTVFAGFFQLRPEGVSNVTFKYKLPGKVGKEYKLFIQKQPGTDGFLYTINLGKHMEEFKLTTDREIKIGI
jgi:hypothetical protein